MGRMKELAKKAFGWLSADEAWSGLVWAPAVLPVRENDARTNSVVMACVFWAMRNAGQAIPVVQRLEDGLWVTIANHPLAELLRNPQSGLATSERTGLSGRKMVGALTYSRMLDGNAYLWKVRNRAGQVIGLDWLPHSSVMAKARTDRPGLVASYEVSTSSGTLVVDPADVVHDRDGIDPGNPTSGLSRLKCVMRQVMTDNQIAAYCQSIMRSPVPSLMVSVRGDGTKITQEDADYIAQKIQEKASGEKAGGVVVPTFSADITPVGYKPDEMAIEAMNRLPEERITAVFGIPAMVLGLGSGMTKSTYSNFQEAREAAAEEFLIPLWQDLAATLTDQLLPEFESGPGWRVWFDTSSVGVLQDDQGRLHAQVRADLAAGILSREEARAQIGM